MCDDGDGILLLLKPISYNRAVENSKIPDNYSKRFASLSEKQEICISQAATRTATSRIPATPKAKPARPGLLKTPALRKTQRRRLLRVGIIAGNLLLLAGVLYLVLAPSRGAATVANKQSGGTSNSATNPAQISALDQLASASIAQTVAQMTGVAEVTPITNQADTERANLNQSSLDDDLVAYKPQVIESAYKSNKDIQIYVVQAGDTVSKIASKFGVTSDSIRWSNDLSGDTVNKGKKLRIPPVNGMVYEVKKGDTTKSLALKYDIPEAKIIQYNDAELHGIAVGELIILPGASKASEVVRAVSFYRQPSYGYNGYDYGYCTWWVAEMRARAGNPLPVGLGNASSWPYWAKVFGLPHGYEPRVGAAVVTQFYGEGHVAYVTAVKGPNTITISEMNYAGGWGVVHTRTITGNFFYIY